MSTEAHLQTDESLIRQCIAGKDDAWTALIDHYKNLIFSVPIRFGVPREEAADIFQAVCLELLSSLPQLRDTRALPKWLIQVSYRKCLLWKKNHRDFSGIEDKHSIEGDAAQVPHELLNQAENEQAMREVIDELSPRCQQMIRMLFFENPARPYEEIAKQLGLATGSIGFIRGRCLKRMRQALENRGFR
jgi:RNA polymerase sigma factor (sigma-70 family)